MSNCLRDLLLHQIVPSPSPLVSGEATDALRVAPDASVTSSGEVPGVAMRRGGVIGAAVTPPTFEPGESTATRSPARRGRNQGARDIAAANDSPNEGRTVDIADPCGSPAAVSSLRIAGDTDRAGRLPEPIEGQDSDRGEAADGKGTAGDRSTGPSHSLVEASCRYCGIDLIHSEHHGWMPPSWVPFDGTTDSAYCEDAPDNDHAPDGGN
jgi:hypothetical protein